MLREQRSWTDLSKSRSVFSLVSTRSGVFHVSNTQHVVCFLSLKHCWTVALGGWQATEHGPPGSRGLRPDRARGAGEAGPWPFPGTREGDLGKCSDRSRLGKVRTSLRFQVAQGLTH